MTPQHGVPAFLLNAKLYDLAGHAAELVELAFKTRDAHRNRHILLSQHNCSIAVSGHVISKYYTSELGNA